MRGHHLLGLGQRIHERHPFQQMAEQRIEGGIRLDDGTQAAQFEGDHRASYQGGIEQDRLAECGWIAPQQVDGALGARRVQGHPGRERAFQRGLDGGAMPLFDRDHFHERAQRKSRLRQRARPVAPIAHDAQGGGLCLPGPADSRGLYRCPLGLGVRFAQRHRLTFEVVEGGGAAAGLLGRELRRARALTKLRLERQRSKGPFLDRVRGLLPLLLQELQAPLHLADLRLGREPVAMAVLPRLQQSRPLLFQPVMEVAPAGLFSGGGFHQRQRAFQLPGRPLDLMLQLFDHPDAGTLGFRKPLDLPAGSLERLGHRLAALLDDANLVLRLRQAKPALAHQLLMRPAGLTGAQEGVPVGGVAGLEIGQGRIRLRLPGAGRLLPAAGAPQLQHRLAPGIPGQASLKDPQLLGDRLIVAGR